MRCKKTHLNAEQVFATTMSRHKMLGREISHHPSSSTWQGKFCFGKERDTSSAVRGSKNQSSSTIRKKGGSGSSSPCLVNTLTHTPKKDSSKLSTKLNALSKHSDHSKDGTTCVWNGRHLIGHRIVPRIKMHYIILSY